MKTRYAVHPTFLVLLVLLIALVSSCEKGPDFREFNYPAPVVTDFTPKQGYAGSAVTITGKDFGTTLKAVKVYFGEVRADSVKIVEDNKIVVLAPVNGVTGKLKVEIYGKSDLTKEDFVYMPSAKFISASTDKAQVGDEITVTGENFGTDIQKVKAYIGNVEGTVVSVTPNQIKFKVADGPSASIVLMIDGQRVVGSYVMVGMEKLVGSLFGHAGSWNNNPATTIQAAVDGDIATYVDGANKIGYMGYDMGAGKGAMVKSVRYVPRSTHASRMLNGEIRGANDPSLSDYVVLHKITAVPPVGVYTEANIANEQTFRYIYYYTAEGNGNIAEIEFYGNVVDKPIPVGKLAFEFNTDNEGWVPQQSATYAASAGALNVTFSQTGTEKRRADLKLTNLPISLHTGDYPIVAIKMKALPVGAVYTFDVSGGAFGNGSKKESKDFVADNVIYWDISVLGQGTNPPLLNAPILFNAGQTFQFKIADIPAETAPAGYSIEWIRTFSSKEELAKFIGK